MANYLFAGTQGAPVWMKTSLGDGLATASAFVPSVAIVDGSGNQITSFGGGTQYAAGTTAATPTGTVAMGKNASNVINALSLDASGYLQVNVAAGGGSGGTSSTFGAAIPGTGTAAGFSDGTNMQLARLFDGDTGAGTEYNLGVILRKTASGGTVEAGTATNPLRVDPTGSTTQPVSGTVSITANSSVNVAQLAGTTTDTNSGNKSAGTLRVVLATDQPALTNKLLVTPDANSSVNLSQVGGSSVSTVATGVAKVGISDSGGSAFLSAANGLNSTGSGLQASQIIAQFDDVSPTAITENQFGNLRISTNRNLYNTIRDAAGNERGANVNSSNQLSVSVDNTPAATVTGNVASGSSDSGNPVKIGGVGRNAAPAAVTNGQRVDMYSDLAGRPVVTLGAPRELKGWQQTTITASTSETTIVTAGAAGVFNDLTGLEITNSSATATLVTLKDSTGGTTRAIYSIGANSGIVVNMNDGMGIQATAANNWTLTCGTSVSSIYVVARFNKNK